MLLIGLFGGSPESRDAIAHTLVRADEAAISFYRLSPAEGLDGKSRAENLAVVLRGHHARMGQRGALIVSHVTTLEEARAIRARGGHLWHVMGAPCEVVPIKAGDLPVTHMIGGCRHFLDPLEALSQEIIRRQAAA